MFIKRLLIFLSSLGIFFLLINPLNKPTPIPPKNQQINTSVPIKPTLTEIPKYTCPQKEWIDCMPIINQGKKASCQPDYLEWVADNCPNFQGVAY